jgi:hypothetical protein
MAAVEQRSAVTRQSAAVLAEEQSRLCFEGSFGFAEGPAGGGERSACWSDRAEAARNVSRYSGVFPLR